MTKFPKLYRLVITKWLPFRKKHESSVTERCEIFSSETHTVSEFVLCGSFFTSEMVRNGMHFGSFCRAGP